MRNITIFTIFRRLYSYVRHWRYKNDIQAERGLALIDFIDHAKEFMQYWGGQPLLATQEGVFAQSIQNFYLYLEPRHTTGRIGGLESGSVWEPAAMRHCLEWMRPGGTFLDIGANLGIFSLAICTTLPNVISHAFEPVPINFQVCQANIKINRHENRIIMNCAAVGDHLGTIQMVVDGKLSHVNATDQGELEIVQVPILTLDSYAEKNQIKDIRLIKCDVEGYEKFVVSGALEILKNQRPGLLLEIEERWCQRYHYAPLELFQFLENLGYIWEPIPDEPGQADQEPRMFLFRPTVPIL